MSGGEKKKKSVNKMEHKRILTREDLMVPTGTVQEEDKESGHTLKRMHTVTNYELAFDHLYKQLDDEEYVDDMKTSLRPGYEKKKYKERYDKGTQTERKLSKSDEEQYKKQMEQAFLSDSDVDEFKDVYNSDEDEYHSVNSTDNIKEYINLEDGKKMLRKTKFVIRSDSFTGGIYLILFNEKGEFKAIPIGKGFVKEIEVEVKPKWGDKPEIIVSDNERILHPSSSVIPLYYEDGETKKDLKVIPPYKYLKLNIIEDLQSCSCISKTCINDLCHKRRMPKKPAKKSSSSSSSTSSLDLTVSETELDVIPDRSDNKSRKASSSHDYHEKHRKQGKQKERRKRSLSDDRKPDTLSRIYGEDPSRIHVLATTDDMKDTKSKKKRKNAIEEHEISQVKFDEKDQVSEESTIKDESNSGINIKDEYLINNAFVEAKKPKSVVSSLLRYKDEKKMKQAQEETLEDYREQPSDTEIQTKPEKLESKPSVIIKQLIDENILHKVSEIQEKPKQVDKPVALKGEREIPTPTELIHDKKLKKQKVQIPEKDMGPESRPSTSKKQSAGETYLEMLKTESDLNVEVKTSSQTNVISPSETAARKTSVYETLERVDNEMKPLKNKIAEIQRQMWEIDSAYPLATKSLSEDPTCKDRSSTVEYEPRHTCLNKNCTKNKNSLALCNCRPGQCNPVTFPRASRDRKMRPSSPLSELPTATELAESLLGSRCSTPQRASAAIWSEPEDVPGNESGTSNARGNPKKDEKKKEDKKRRS